MSIETAEPLHTVCPSSLEGIKRLAKSIKVERGIRHSDALDEASKAAHFENYRHARRVLLSKGAPPVSRPRQCLFLTAYWEDRESDAEGRETLTLELTAPWEQLIQASQLNIPRGLMWFRPEGPDHLAHRTLSKSQSIARQRICAAARTMQFIDATKLRPSKSHSRAYPGGSWMNAVPGSRHSSVWYDRSTKRYLFVDEPYELAVLSRADERSAWARKHGYQIIQPAWPGMYGPDAGSRLYLIADAEQGVPLAPIAAALDKLPPPIVESGWNGESAPSSPYFFSPGAIARAEASQAKASPKPRAMKHGKRATVGYVRSFVGPQRRPDSKMPIEVHRRVGLLLKSVLAVSYYRKGVYNNLDLVRSELDEWTMREYTSKELPNEQFSDLYYHGENRTFQRTISTEQRLQHIASLEEVKTILHARYPDCAPLRNLLKRLGTAIGSMRSWGSQTEQEIPT